MPTPTAPGLVLSPTAQVAGDVQFGANVVVHGDTVIGAGVVIQDGVILGKPPRLAPTSATAAPVDEPLIIEAGASICAQAIVFAGARIGEGAIIGDQSYVRERTVIGAWSLVGRGACVDNDVVVGDRVKLQSQVYVTAFSVIEDDVFVGPRAMTTNDNTMARRGPTDALVGATLRRACRIGGGAVLTPGVEIGEEAYIAAGSVVTNHVPPRGVLIGVPGRVVRYVEDIDLLESDRG